ncbi:hypothetical protein AKO1_013171 [Acrasis kona]|uniref:HECT domain-containing protein n=1 Tax=Acrasis kona TaxID=1008807 RepID=A0AAW2Z071_9EUKA
MDSKVMNPNQSILNVIYKHTNHQFKHPSQVRTMDTSTITFQYQSSSSSSQESSTFSENSKLPIQLDEFNGHDSNVIDTCNQLLTNHSTTNISTNHHVHDCLQLLSLIYKSNQKLNFIIDPLELINTKLQSKVNRQLQDVYSLFSKTLPDWIDHYMSNYSFLFSYQIRKLYFDLTTLGLSRSLAKSSSSFVHNNNPLSFGNGSNHDLKHVIKIDKIKIKLARDDHLLQSAFMIFEKHQDTKSVIEFEYLNEIGTGLGPTAEFYSLISTELTNPNLQIWNENVKNELFPKAIMDPVLLSRAIKIFEFIGKFVARALMDNRIIDMPFHNCFLRLLQGQSLCFSDLMSIDSNYYNILNQIRTNPSCAPTFMCNMVLPGDDGIELVPNGHQVDLMESNSMIYVNRIAQIMLNDGIKNQVAAFQRGYDSILPSPGISSWKMFSTIELDDMVSGCDEIWNVDNLVNATKCDHGFSHNSKTVRWLFKVMCELDKQEKRLFVKFLTGSPKLPSGGIKNLNPKLTIVLKITEGGGTSDQYLPSVMTCTNYLKLPDYSNEFVLKEQLLKAIRMGQNAFLLS